MWTYKYNEDTDETEIKHNGDVAGVIDGQITSWRSGMPVGEAKEIIKDAVDEPMIVDLLYGFSKFEDTDEQRTPIATTNHSTHEINMD